MNRSRKIATTLIMVGLTLTACSSSPSLLVEAHEACSDHDLSGVTLDDDRGAMTINGAGRQDDGTITEDGIATYLAYECIEDALDVPQFVRDEMGATTSLQGRQSANWDDLEATWSYHPNNGLNITYRELD